jgi:hypothetical protein
MKPEISSKCGLINGFPDKSSLDCTLMVAFGKAIVPKTRLHYGNLKKRGFRDLKKRGSGHRDLETRIFNNPVSDQSRKSPTET